MDQVKTLLPGYLVRLSTRSWIRFDSSPWTFGSTSPTYEELVQINSPLLGLLIKLHPDMRSWIRSSLLTFDSAVRRSCNSSQAAPFGRLQWFSSRWQTHPAAFQHFQEPYICVYNQMSLAHSIHSKNSHVESNTECTCVFQKEKETGLSWCRLNLFRIANGVPSLTILHCFSTEICIVTYQNM